MFDLFSDQSPRLQDRGHGITLLARYANSDQLLPLIKQVLSQSPLRHMSTRMGHNMRVTTSNCGDYGGHSDQNGYRYLSHDPLTHTPWPTMPKAFSDLATKAAQEAGVDYFTPDSCLINHYPIGVSMGSHQDKEESHFNWPIVSVSLGLSAIFQVFGNSRSGVEQEIQLNDGDVLVLSGHSRLFYHGVKPVKADPLQPNLTERFNLTFRKAR